MIRRPPRSTLSSSSAASDVYKRQVVSIKDKYRQIFDWLGLLDMNVWVILILMVLVAGFNMVSSLLVIILERTQMIGILKAMGARNWSIRKVFLYFSVMLILKALIWGNLLGIGICLIQQYTHFLKLDPSSYYLEYVPVQPVSYTHLT